MGLPAAPPPSSPPAPPHVRSERATATADDRWDPGAASAVTALYHANALGLVRLAYIMIGDQGTAEDIVQDAFCGLYRRWAHLDDPGKALAYVRSSVLNGCRSARRRRQPELTSEVALVTLDQSPAQADGEAAAISEEERIAVIAALRRLPRRQREVVVLRFYLDMSEAQIATEMGIAQSTVRSSAHRAIASLGRILRGQS